MALAGLTESMNALVKTNSGRRAVFFDRDNTLVVDRGYTFRVEDLRWIAGAPAAIQRFNDAGWLVVVCTNQSGVARGFFGEADVLAFHTAMSRSLSAMGAKIDAFYYCAHHPDAVVERYRGDHPERKPNPGMLLRAMRELGIDASSSLMIGDSASDIAAATGAGVEGWLFPGGRLDDFVGKLPQFATTS